MVLLFVVFLCLSLVLKARALSFGLLSFERLAIIREKGAENSRLLRKLVEADICSSYLAHLADSTMFATTSALYSYSYM